MLQVKEVPRLPLITVPALTANKLVTGRGITLIPRGTAAGTNNRTGRVHYTTIEEIPEGEVVTAGMFLVNQHPAVVLFDTGASHSFMSQAFASKHGQHVVDLC